MLTDLKSITGCEILFSGSLKTSREFSYLGVYTLGSQELKHQAKLEQWRAQIVECRGSGLSVRKWCMEHHIGQKTYYRWEKEILETASAQLPSITPAALSRTTFAELPAPAVQQPVQAEMVASIRIGKAKVDIYSGADASVVKALCQILKSC